jgi:hypothetical protein
MEKMRERVARALCELRIRDVRRFDTSADELEAMLPGAVDYAWQDFLPQASAALSLMQPEIDRRVAEEKAKLFERFDEDELEQIISNSLDMDWRPRDAARAIRQAMLAAFQQENSDGR